MGDRPENKQIRRICAGLLAHVDAGKTTLSEALLYCSGALRNLGRVDHSNSFLDTHILERERGITIFYKQAVLQLDGVELTLVDTPGHVDFSAETERTLPILDCGILVISGPDGPQGHTVTLWRLLERHNTPVFLFLNKMDQPVNQNELMRNLHQTLSDRILDFSTYGSDEFWETAALGDEAALNEYLETGMLNDKTLRRLICERKCFPCLFGCALKAQGAKELLEIIFRFGPRPQWGDEFSAKVFKITRDSQGTRLTHMKLTGGSLSVKSMIPIANGAEKTDQIRVYSGAKFRAVNEAYAGMVCAVVGPSSTYPGQILGNDSSSAPPSLEPALSYRLILPQGVEPNLVMPKLRELSEEDPQLHIEWNESLGEINLRLMGQIQAEILQRVISDRFGLNVEFGPGNVVYKETICAPVEGVGHFEPLRHYAEVHLLLEPLPLGSGLEFQSNVSEDIFARNWQRLVLTHLEEKIYRGVLTNSAITDMRISIVSGRAHEKHTEGGDFREATYRAVRHGLMKAKHSGKAVLLEPWYSLRLEVPETNLGRALTDIQRMGGEADAPTTIGNENILIAKVPVEAFGDYAKEFAAYTKGRGRLSFRLDNYRPCKDPDIVVSRIGYDPEQDPGDPAGSVFCAHGSGLLVHWSEVENHCHLPLLNIPQPDIPAGHLSEAPQNIAKPPESPKTVLEQDAELLRIFERTYGQIKPRDIMPRQESVRDTVPQITLPELGPEYLLVDGYNIIFSWDDLSSLAKIELESARSALMDILSNYQGFRQNRIILVFDAYKVPRGSGSINKYHNIHVVYTKEAETADTYIEKASYILTKDSHRVLVASSDFAEQLIILGHGALRITAAELRAEIERAQGEIAAILDQHRLALMGGTMRDAFRRAHGDKTV